MEEARCEVVKKFRQESRSFWIKLLKQGQFQISNLGTVHHPSPHPVNRSVAKGEATQEGKAIRREGDFCAG